MEIIIRKAVDADKPIFVEYTEKLSRFNRGKHGEECKYDDYDAVLQAIREKAADTFTNRDTCTLILIAEMDSVPVGYALGRIYEEDRSADNGTGRVGLFDELYVEDAARGTGIGKQLIDEVFAWMKGKGINRIKLHAYSWNSNAKKLYEKLGFREYAVSYEKFI